MKFLRKAVFSDTTVVQAGTFKEAMELFKDEDYYLGSKPDSVEYFQLNDIVQYSVDEVGNYYVHAHMNKEHIVSYAQDRNAAESMVSAINRNHAARLNPNGLN